MEIALQQILVRLRERCHQCQMPVRFGLIYMSTFMVVRVGGVTRPWDELPGSGGWQEQAGILAALMRWLSMMLS